MEKIKWFLPLLYLLLVVGCSSDFKDPENVIRTYFKFTFSDKDTNLDKAYKYLSSESQRHTDLNEFKKEFIEGTFRNVTRQITQLNILPEDKEHPMYRRVKITFDAIDNSNSTQNEVRYYTLIKENSNWKIVWSSVDTNSYNQRFIDDGLYDEAIKLAEDVLSFNPYDAEVYGQMAYCYYRLNNPEKSVANIRKAIALLPEALNYIADFISNYINNDSLGNCSNDVDDCLYSKISIYYKTWEINDLIADSKFNEAWEILQLIKPNIKEDKYKEIAESHKTNEIQSMVKYSEFDKAWKTLKSAKPHLTKDAYQRLTAIIDKEQYKPRSTQEAIEEWIEFRKNEDTHKGKIVTWRFQVSDIYNTGRIAGYLDDTLDYRVNAYYNIPYGVKEKDWVIVSGKFDYVRENNTVILSAIKIENEGYKENYEHWR